MKVLLFYHSYIDFPVLSHSVNQVDLQFVTDRVEKLYNKVHQEKAETSMGRITSWKKLLPVTMH